jgi:hypothetical protein
MNNSRQTLLNTVTSYLNVTNKLDLKLNHPTLQLYDLKQSYSDLLDQSRQSLIVSAYLLSGTIEDDALTVLNNGTDSMTNAQFKTYIDAQIIGTDVSDNLVTVAQAIAAPDTYFKEIENFVSEAENLYFERAASFHLLDTIVLDGFTSSTKTNLLENVRGNEPIAEVLSEIKSQIYAEHSAIFGFTDEAKIKCESEFNKVINLGKVIDDDKIVYDGLDLSSPRAALTLSRLFTSLNLPKIFKDNSGLSSNSAYLTTIQQYQDDFATLLGTDDSVATTSPVSLATPLDLWLESGFNVIGDIFVDGFNAMEAAAGAITSFFKTVVDGITNQVSQVNADLTVANNLGLTFSDENIPWYTYNASFMSLPGLLDPLSTLAVPFNGTTEVVSVSETYTATEEDILQELLTLTDPDLGTETQAFSYDLYLDNILPVIVRMGQLRYLGDAIIFVGSHYFVRIEVTEITTDVISELTITTHPAIPYVGFQYAYGEADDTDKMDGIPNTLIYTNSIVLTNKTAYAVLSSQDKAKMVLANGIYNDYDEDGIFNGMNIIMGATHQKIKSIAHMFADATMETGFPLLDSYDTEVTKGTGDDTYDYFPIFYQFVKAYEASSVDHFRSLRFGVEGTYVSSNYVVSAYTPSMIAKKIETYILNGGHESVSRQISDNTYVNGITAVDQSLGNSFAYIGTSWAARLIDKSGLLGSSVSSGLVTSGAIGDAILEDQNTGGISVAAKTTALTAATRTYASQTLFRPTAISVDRIDRNVDTSTNTTSQVAISCPLTDLLLTTVACIGVRGSIAKNIYYPDMAFSFSPATDEDKVKAFNDNVIKPYITNIAKAAAIAGLLIFGPKVIKKIANILPDVIKTMVNRRRRNKLMDAIGDTSGTTGTILSTLNSTVTPKLVEIDSKVAGLKGSVSN